MRVASQCNKGDPHVDAIRDVPDVFEQRCWEKRTLGFEVPKLGSGGVRTVILPNYNGVSEIDHAVGKQTTK
jgi:hypothetical protein